VASFGTSTFNSMQRDWAVTNCLDPPTVFRLPLQCLSSSKPIKALFLTGACGGVYPDAFALMFVCGCVHLRDSSSVDVVAVLSRSFGPLHTPSRLYLAD
jgi:hypothetical protein